MLIHTFSHLPGNVPALTYNHNFRTQDVDDDVSNRGGVEASANRGQFIRVVLEVEPPISFISSAAVLDLGLREFVRQPVQSLVEAVTLGRTRRLDVPLKGGICLKKRA